MSAVDNENFLNVPGVAILPLGIILQANLLDKIINFKKFINLGTGNELSKVVGWGSTYDDESIEQFIEKVKKGKLIGIDRYLKLLIWLITSYIILDYFIKDG